MKPPLGTQLNFSNVIAGRFVGFWLFNEGGDFVHDLTGNHFGINGPSIYGTPAWTQSDFGPAFYPNGSGHITFPDGGPCDISGADAKLTIMAWASLDSIVGGRHLVNKYLGSPGQRQFQIYYNADGFMRFSLSSNGTSYSACDSSDVIEDGKLHQIVATYDGSYMKVYIDGLLDCTPTAHAGGIYNGGQLFRIGGDPSGNSWPGVIDQVGILPCALTDAEIALLFLEPFGMFGRDLYVKTAGANDIELEAVISATGSLTGTLTVPGDSQSRLFGRPPGSYATRNCITRRKVFT